MGKFDDPVFVDPSKLSPEELKAHELRREAWRRAIDLGDSMIRCSSIRRSYRRRN